MLGFVRDALEISRPNAFFSAFLPFQERIAQLGISNSIVHTALKLTLPGVPDIYQGTDLGDPALSIPTTVARSITEHAADCSSNCRNYWDAIARRRYPTCLRTNGTVVSNWQSSRSYWPTAASAQSCLQKEDINR